MRLSPDVRSKLRLLHYWWPVAMGASIAVVVQRATARPIDGVGLALLLCGILTAYSLDRIVDTQFASHTRWLRWALRMGAATGVIASACLLVLMPLRTALLVPVLGGVVLAYPRLKSVPVLKTVLVSAAWTWSLIAFPFPDASWLGWHAWTTPVALPLTLIIASGCFLCDLKDVEADREASVSSLPVVMSVDATISTAVVLAAVGAAVALAEHRPGLSIGGVVLALVALRPTLVARSVIGPLLVDMTLTIPGVLIVLHLV